MGQAIFRYRTPPRIEIGRLRYEAPQSRETDQPYGSRGWREGSLFRVERLRFGAAFRCPHEGCEPSNLEVDDWIAEALNV
jgi:hypothetical protein